MINKNDLINKKNNINYLYKITKSMEVISISKYKLLYKKLKYCKLYNNCLFKILNNINLSNNNFFLNYNINNFDKILYFVISTDKSLCGNLNINLYKEIIFHIKKKYINKKIIFFLLGKKSNLLINILKNNNIKYKILKQYLNLNIVLNNIKKFITDIILKFYKFNKVKIFIFSNIYKDKKIKVNIFQILPLNFKNNYNNTVYYYENNKFYFFKKIILEYINSKIFFYILNNLISEYFSRILIMKNSSWNLKKIFKKINLFYNKIRQFNITKEIISFSSNFK